MGRRLAIASAMLAVPCGGCSSAPASQPACDCHPSYDPCVPYASDVDCSGGCGNGPAYTGQVSVVGPDVYDLDRDDAGEGVAVGLRREVDSRAAWAPAPHGRVVQSLLRRNVTPWLGDVPLGNLDTPLIREWRSRLLDEGASASVAAKAYGLLRAVLMTAVNVDRLILRNPCRVRGWRS